MPFLPNLPSINRQDNYGIPVKFKCFRKAKSTLTGRKEQIWGHNFQSQTYHSHRNREPSPTHSPRWWLLQWGAYILQRSSGWHLQCFDICLCIWEQAFVLLAVLASLESRCLVHGFLQSHASGGTYTLMLLQGHPWKPRCHGHFWSVRSKALFLQEELCLLQTLGLQFNL